jgi:hypothetical protein
LLADVSCTKERIPVHTLIGRFIAYRGFHGGGSRMHHHVVNDVVGTAAAYNKNRTQAKGFVTQFHRISPVFG